MTERAAYIGRIRNLSRARGAEPTTTSPRAARLPDARQSRAVRRSRLSEDDDAAIPEKKPPCWSNCSAEELPPKALQKLGEAFAEGAARRLVARHGPPADGSASCLRPYATPRRLAVRLSANAGRARRQGRRPQKAACRCPWRSTRTASPRPPLAQETGADARPSPDQLAPLERATARPKPSSCEGTRRARHAGRRPAEGAGRNAIAKLPIPKVMTLPARRRLRTAAAGVRAPGARPDRAAWRRGVVPVERAGPRRPAAPRTATAS